MEVKSLVLCCGSRNWSQWVPIERALHLLTTINYTYFFRKTTVMHGDASGADAMSDSVARLLGLNVVRVRANWLKFGKRAGPVRNTAMLERKPDYVIAFWDGVSRGTLDTIQKAVNVYRIPTIIVRSQ